MKQYVFGIDVGGTSAKIGFFSADGNLLDKWEIPTGLDKGGEESLRDIADALCGHLSAKGLALDDLIGVGLAVPGPVLEDGSVCDFANLSWGNINVRDTLSSMLEGVHVAVGNDAAVAALGELWSGAGRGYRSIVMVTLGTGVGGGVVVDGKIVSGAHGAGGEIGHILVNPDETAVCGCGKKGCLEQYASATGLVRIMRHLLANEKDAALSSLNGKKPDAKMILDAAKEGDPLALSALNTMCRYLGRTLATVAQVTDPEVFVIGGGVSKAGTILLETIRKYYEPAAFFATKTTHLCLAQLGNDGGMYGAARMLL